MAIDALLFIAIRGIGAGALFGLIGMSFNIVHNSSTVLNFAQGSMLVLGALGALLLAKNGMTLPLWLWGAYLIATALGLAVLLAVQGTITLIPLGYSNDSHSWLITTMAVSVIIGSAMLIMLGPYSATVDSPLRGALVFNMYIPAPYFFAIALLILWYLALRWFLGSTLPGLAINALSQDFDAARAAGLKVRRLQVLAFAISGLIVGSAGFAAAPVITIAPEAGLKYVIYGFIASVIGGIGNNTGALIGGPIIGLISAFATYQLGGEFESLVLVLVLVTMLLIRPKGIFGTTAERRV
jgi:branched-chain amino acid transport system permease protein